MPKLTKRVADAAQPRATDYFIWDDEMPRFGLRVLRTGKKTYVVQYRSGGRTRRVSFGRHGTLTPDEARKKARELLVDVADGGNPSEERQRQRRAPTVAALCERFLAEHVAHRCKPGTQREYRRSVDLFINPAIGSFKVVDVARPDIARLHHSMRHIPYQANRTFGVLSKLFNLAEEWGLRPDGSNPCRHVRKYREEKRERFLSAEELQRLGDVLSEAEADGSETPYVTAAFRLLILTGCRRSEIQTLKWAYVTESYLELPDSKTGARRIPLPPTARVVLDRLPRLPDNEYVIAGAMPGKHVTDLEKPWRRIRARAGLEGVRIHDLRHTYASNAVMQGLNLPLVGKLLGHSQIQTTMRYAHLADDPVRQAAEQVSRSLSLAIAGPERPVRPSLRVVK